MENLECVADTILYEQAMETIRRLEKDKYNIELAKLNINYYKEFNRRNKTVAYYLAYSNVCLEMGKWKGSKN